MLAEEGGRQGDAQRGVAALGKDKPPAGFRREAQLDGDRQPDDRPRRAGHFAHDFEAPRDCRDTHIHRQVRRREGQHGTAIALAAHGQAAAGGEEAVRIDRITLAEFDPPKGAAGGERRPFRIAQSAETALPVVQDQGSAPGRAQVGLGGKASGEEQSRGKQDALGHGYLR